MPSTDVYILSNINSGHIEVAATATFVKPQYTKPRLIGTEFKIFRTNLFYLF